MTTTTAQTITVLKHLANGRQPDFVAQATHLPLAEVERIAEDYSWPDMDEVRGGIFRLTKSQLDLPKSTTLTAPTTPRQLPTPLAAAPPAAAPSPVQRPAPPTLDGPTRLLAEAAKSSKKRTQALGVKVAGLLADLEDAITAETAERGAREKAERDKAANAKRIAELEAELAALKGKPAAAGTSPNDGPPASTIRAWAADNGLECPPVGRVPKTVREAYDNAHDQHTAA